MSCHASFDPTGPALNLCPGALSGLQLMCGIAVHHKGLQTEGMNNWRSLHGNEVSAISQASRNSFLVVYVCRPPTVSAVRRWRVRDRFPRHFVQSLLSYHASWNGSIRIVFRRDVPLLDWLPRSPLCVYLNGFCLSKLIDVGFVQL